MRKLVLALALAAGACGSGGDDGAGGAGGEPNPRVAKCGECPINASRDFVPCCAPRDAKVACIKNSGPEVGQTPCPGTQIEVTCFDFDRQREYSQGCESGAFQCYAYMYSSNPGCCYETASGWNGANWVGPDGKACSVAYCDGRQACQ